MTTSTLHCDAKCTEVNILITLNNHAESRPIKLFVKSYFK